MTEGQRLAEIRHGLSAISPGRWSLAHDGDGYLVMADSEMDGGRIELCRLGPLASDAERAFLAGAPEAVDFLLRLVDRAAHRVRVLESRTERMAEARPDPGAEAETQQRPTTGRTPGDDPSWWREKPAKDYAAQAAMLCASRGFQRFLVERKGLREPASEDAAASRVRSLCGVVSRRDINGDERAQKAWREVYSDYSAWLRA